MGKIIKLIFILVIMNLGYICIYSIMKFGYSGVGVRKFGEFENDTKSCIVTENLVDTSDAVQNIVDEKNEEQNVIIPVKNIENNDTTSIAKTTNDKPQNINKKVDTDLITSTKENNNKTSERAEIKENIKEPVKQETTTQIQTQPQNEAQKEITPNDLEYWCVSGGNHHIAGDGVNEHGYYSSWNEAQKAFENYTSEWLSVQYKISQCSCGLYYFWAIQ